METPICTKSGYSYESKDISDIVTSGGTDPMSWEELTPKDLYPNKNLKKAIIAYEQNYPFAWDT